MYYYVYIIKSSVKEEQIYIGFTKNIKQRLKSHNNGESKHTKKFKPWAVVYASAFLKKQTAVDFERYLKSSSGKAFMRKRLISPNL